MRLLLEWVFENALDEYLRAHAERGAPEPDPLGLRRRRPHRAAGADAVRLRARGLLLAKQLLGGAPGGAGAVTARVAETTAAAMMQQPGVHVFEVARRRAAPKHPPPKPSTMGSFMNFARNRDDYSRPSDDAATMISMASSTASSALK